MAMWFGQKLYKKDDQTIHGKWLPFAHRQEAIDAGCDLVSVLDLCCTLDQYQTWQEAHPGGRMQVRFRGPFYADFDDLGDLTGLKGHLVEALWDLVDDFGLQENHFQLWFSGAKGFHLLIQPTLFTTPDFAHHHLPNIYRDFALALGFGEIMDSAVYSEGKGRLWRVAGKRRPNGCRKIPLSLAQLTNLTVNEIRRLSQAPRHIPDPPKQVLKPNKAFCELFDEVVALNERNRRAAQKPKSTKPKPKSQTKHGSRPPRQAWDDPDIRDIEALLAELPERVVDEYGDWLRVGMALHHASEGEDWGLELWDDWSRQSPKYQADVLVQKWPGFGDVEDGVTLGTLFYLARRDKEDRRKPRR